jgi:predicted nicotinamide N-methyase
MTTRDNTTIVSLGDGLIQGQDANASMSLHLSGSIEEVSNNDIKHNSINHVGDGTHGMVWASGTVLAQALTSAFGLQFLKEMFSRCYETLHEHGNNQNIARRHLNCLELGSGLGVCGLALAHALNRLCGNSECVAAKRATILLTDHGETSVELLRKNIKRNLPPSFCGRSIDTNDRKCMNNIYAQPLVWGNAFQSTSNLTMADELRYNLILGSDILYNTHESYDPLVNTIQRYLHPHGGTILLAVRWRKPDIEREFFHMVEERCKGLKFELWKEFIDDKDFGGRRCPCVLNWKDYGNPDCESSNLHFHETTICIEKKQTASNNVELANITERDMELMTDDEYSKFEELQVQIYVGRYEGLK